jgi:hypothetical protein
MKAILFICHVLLNGHKICCNSALSTHPERPQTSQVKRPSRSSSVSWSGATFDPKKACPVVKCVNLRYTGKGLAVCIRTSLFINFVLYGVTPDMCCRVGVRAANNCSLPDGLSDAIALGIHPAELVADLVPAKDRTQHITETGGWYSNRSVHVHLLL